MDLVYYWTTWLLILVSTTLAFYCPSSGDLDPRNKMTHVSLKLAFLIKAWIILFTMATASYITRTTTNILAWLCVIAAQKCLHLQEKLYSLFNSIVGCVNYWQIHQHYGHMRTSQCIYGIHTAEDRCNDILTYRQCRPEFPSSYICTSVRRRSRQFITFVCTLQFMSLDVLYRKRIKVKCSPREHYLCKYFKYVPQFK